jgi:hypothetical protein
MKKKLMAVAALMLTISLQASVVYASESPTGSNNDSTIEVENTVDDAVAPPTGPTLSGNVETIPDAEVDYTENLGTISGDATSPKTADSSPYTIPVGMAAVGFAGIAIFGRKLVRK